MFPCVFDPRTVSRRDHAQIEEWLDTMAETHDEALKSELAAKLSTVLHRFMMMDEGLFHSSLCRWRIQSGD